MGTVTGDEEIPRPRASGADVGVKFDDQLESGKKSCTLSLAYTVRQGLV